MQQDDQLERGILVALLAVIGFMSWPVWGEIVAGERGFTAAVAWSAVVPLILSLLAPAVWFRFPTRMRHGLGAVEHALHVDTLIHHGRHHRHA
jgi:hypothetical protein